MTTPIDFNDPVASGEAAQKAARSRDIYRLLGGEDEGFAYFQTRHLAKDYKFTISGNPFEEETQ